MTSPELISSGSPSIHHVPAPRSAALLRRARTFLPRLTWRGIHCSLARLTPAEKSIPEGTRE